MTFGGALDATATREVLRKAMAADWTIRPHILDLRSGLASLLPTGCRIAEGWFVDPRASQTTECDCIHLRFSERILLGRPQAEADALFAEVVAKARIGALRRLAVRIERAAAGPFVVLHAVSFPLATTRGAGSPYVQAQEVVAIYWLPAEGGGAPA